MRMISLLFLLMASLYAETSIAFQKGWQLVGIPIQLEDMSSFSNDKVEIVWGYDSEMQSWKGYSAQDELEQKLIEKEIPLLSSLEPWQAVWVFSKEAWSLHVNDSEIPVEVRNNSIQLYEGWNLIAIPQNSVVSDDFFGDAVVWKYSSDQEWSVNDDGLNFPPLKSIAVSEGLWVKSESTREIKVDEALSKLHTFKSEDAMLSYIRTMMELETYYYAYPELVGGDISANDALETTAPSEEAKEATTTNLQEEGVDEADILKHDGTYIFSVDNTNAKIIVTSFARIAAQEYKPLYEIDMSDQSIAAMYLQNNRLSVVSNRAYYYPYADVSTDETLLLPPAVKAKSLRSAMPYYGNASQHFTLDVFDVSDISDITKVASYDIDGNYRDSRLIEGKLFLISQFYPNIEYEYPKNYINTPCNDLNRDEIYEVCNASVPCELGTECEFVPGCKYGLDYESWNDNSCSQYSYDENGAWQYDYKNPIVKNENLIPSISSGGAPTSLVTPSQFYAPNKLDQRVDITSISRFDTASGTHEDTLSFLGNTHTYYASTSSLYLVSSQYPYYYDYMYSKTQQIIYKFSLDDALSYKGRGSVDGSMLNQFSMSEKDGYLRVATTQGQAWWNAQTINSIYTLKENDEQLEVQGTLSGLGKEGETIKAVRFMGDRGFVVTFRQTDPLYTLDMSDPLNPAKAGELSIPGFSEYLHVIDENRLLAIGRDADEEGRALALQVSLFDISDFSQPQLSDKIKIGEDAIHSHTYSEAEYNHKAFAYRASDMMFGFPYTNYLQSGYSENFGVYQVDGMRIKTVGTLSSSTPNDWGNSARGVIFDFDGSTKAALFKGSHILSETVK